jgi:hypothetical protein
MFSATCKHNTSKLNELVNQKRYMRKLTYLANDYPATKLPICILFYFIFIFIFNYNIMLSKDKIKNSSNTCLGHGTNTNGLPKGLKPAII